MAVGRGAGIAVVSVVFAAMVGAAGYGVYEFAGAGGPDAGPAPARTGPPDAQEVRDAARGFLKAWAGEDAAGAAALTDAPSRAQQAVAEYWDVLDAGSMRTTVRRPSGTRVPFTVKVSLPAGDGKAEWSYESSLTVVRDGADGRAVVSWAPAVLHPSLESGQHLAAGPSDAPPGVVHDRDGRALDLQELPSLSGILPRLRAQAGDGPEGTPGTEVRVVRDGSGETVRTLHTLAKGKPGKPLRTTIDADLQRAAEEAVASRRETSSLVAVDSATGGVLAVANNPAGGFNGAFSGSWAPGSTFKVVTAAALLERGASSGTSLPCPAQLYVNGKEFHNSEGGSAARATLAQDFAASCNTAFISLRDRLPDDALTSTARDVFGLGLEWHTGVESRDASVPPPGGDPVEKAATMIGQGRVQANPLAMASVAATVRSGRFRQPVLVPGQEQVAAARTLSPGVLDQLRSMMRLTATSGTAASALAGLGGDVGAKTGSAEVDGQDTANGWLIAYRGDVAVAAVVERGGHGVDSAGPLVRAVLAAG